MTSRGGRPAWGGRAQPSHSAIVRALLPADRLLSLTLLAFEGLNAAASKDRCLACIEEPFFSPLWPLLLALYRYAQSQTPHRPFHSRTPGHASSGCFTLQPSSDASSGPVVPHPPCGRPSPG